MTREEYLLWLRSQRRRPGLVREVPAKDITTVIKEYEGDTPNTKTTTIKGGLLGDPAQDWDGRGAEHDERGMQDWYANMAQAQARQQQGTAAPSQAEIGASLQRYGDVRRSQFTPPPIGISSPQRARTRLPQPARLPLAHGQDDPQDQRGMKGRPWVLPQDARAELERKRREADQRQRYAQQ